MHHSSDFETLPLRPRRKAWAAAILVGYALAGCAAETDTTDEEALAEADAIEEGDGELELAVSSEALSAREPTRYIDNFGVDDGWRTDRHPRFVEDVTGDGRADVVGFGERGVWVAPSRGTSFEPFSLWSTSFGANQAGASWSVGRHLRVLADVNGDKRKDIVGFGNSGTYVALSTGTSFQAPTLWVANYAHDQGWRVDQHPRFLADVNDDGRADVVAFGISGVWVSLSTGTAFTPPARWVNDFGTDQGWQVARHPRLLADVNGDRRADVVGFGYDGVYVSLALSSSFAPAALWVRDFGYDAGSWRVDRHPRFVADVTGDGLADVVGFGDAGVYVASSTGTGLRPIKLWIADFGYEAGGWRVERHPRFLADANGDGRADVVGFGDQGVYVGRSTGTRFAGPKLVVSSYGYEAGGWRTNLHPRLLARVDRDRTADIVGFGNTGVYVSLLRP